jgi:hypothetical protein
MSYPTCRACGFIVDADRDVCPFCGADPRQAPAGGPAGGAPPAPFGESAIQAEIARHRAAAVATATRVGPAGQGGPVGPPVHDGWWGHLVRYLGVGALVGLGHVVVVGLFWTAAILNRTGYRKRDVALLFVPVLGPFFLIVALWRYTAKSAYWSPRADRPSAPADRTVRPLLVGGGWLAWAGFAVVFVLAVQAMGPTDYVSDEGRFSATFPSRVERSEEMVDLGLGVGPTPYVMYSAETATGLYSVATFDLPPGVPFDVGGAATGAAEAVGGAVANQRPTSVQGYEAAEFLVAIPAGPMVKTLIVRTPTRVYQVQVVANSNPPLGFAEFAASFRIRDPATATSA